MITKERRTKIVCTLGPSSNKKYQIKELVDNGMNVARLNFSHGTNKDHAKMIIYIREVADETGKTVSILMDLQGPKIRVGWKENNKCCVPEVR